MERHIENFIVFNRILFWVLIIASIYPYPVWGSPYQSADHYWPMYNITDGILEDVEGAAHTVVYNGGKIVQVPQLGHALSLDGKDDWVDTGGFNADCVTEPSTCKDGFTMTFWLKVYSTGYVMSSGSFTNHRNGPGYQLYYQQSLKRFKFLLETRDKRWTLLIHEGVGIWTHMAFTWREQSGLSYYEDGNLSTFTDKPVLVSALREQNYTPVITLARPNSIMKFKEYGKFEISQFAIWLKELSAADIAGVYQEGLSYDQNFALCCHFKSVSPCVTNPCYDADQCRKISESTGKKCICPNVNLRLTTCEEKITGECEDKSTGCRDFAAQSLYCKHRKMREICPRSCDYCAPPRPSTTLKPTLKTASSSMSRVSRQSRNPSTVVPTNSRPAGSGITTKPTLWPQTSTGRPWELGTTRRRLPRGKSCAKLSCQYYSRCFQTSDSDAECRCPKTCHTLNAPVCGTNDKSYLNMCVLKLESCLSQTWIYRRDEGLCGVRFTTAAHYLPLNGTTADKKLVDTRGNGTGLAQNGVKQSTADQIGPVMALNGKDSFIELKGIKDKCIVDPSLCREGLSVAFWIKYIKGEFVISGGHYTNSDSGPGFRFVCKSCSKRNGPHLMPSGPFLLELSTKTHKWKILLDSIPKWWFHFAFTWNRNRGLKFYKNGKLAGGSGNPQELERSLNEGASSDEITIGKPNSLLSMFRGNSSGQFSIGHLAIWTYELSAFDVEIAFLSAQTKTTKSMVCCMTMKEDPCITNPCHDGATCQRMEDKYQCICPDINSVCSRGQKRPEPCEDTSADCLTFASQESYCNYHWRRMTDLCPKACGFCGVYEPPLRTSEALTSASLKTNVQLTEIKRGSQSVADALQSENRNAQSTRGGGLSHNLQTLQFTSDGSSMATILSTVAQSQHNTDSRMALATITTFDEGGIINAQTASSYSDFASTRSSILSIMPTASLQSSFKLSKIAGFSQTSEPARFSSILSSHEKFTGSISRLTSNLHVTSNVFSKDELSQEDRSKSTILSYYSTGIVTQPQSVSSALSSVQETPQVLSSSISTAVALDSSSYSSTAVPLDSSSHSSTAVPGDSSSFSSTDVSRESSSLTAFKSYIISSSTTPNAHFTRATTASSFAATTRVISVQPSLSSSVTVQEKAPLTCKVNNVTCVCFNCEQARKNGNTCCMDLIDSRTIDQGVQMNMMNVNVETFHQKASLVSRVIEDVIWDSCKANSTLCVCDENLSSKSAGARKRRSPQTKLLKNNYSSNNLKIKRDSNSDSDEAVSQTLSSSVNTEALRPDINPSKANISSVGLTIYSISSKAGQPDRAQTAFYVTVTSFSNGTNQTQVLDGKGLLQILRDKKHILENRLNITIDSFSAWQSDDSETTSWTFQSTLVPNPSPGSQNLPTPLSTPEVPTTAAVLGRTGDDDDKKEISKEMFILIICAAIGGLILLIVLLVFIFTRFYRQRKGEFVPDKTYPNSHSKQNGEAGVEDVENISSFIDPSTPRITDVPHKPSRGQSSAAGGGGVGGGGKKSKKPMGVKVTYKPPKWD